MAVEVMMIPENCPDLSLEKDPSVEDEATVSFVYVEEGDTIAAGDEIMELVGEKSTFNVVSPVEGKVASVAFREGDAVKTGEVVAVIEEA